MTMVDEGRFPNIVGALREAGLDPMTQRVPVAPASHYVMGGIVTDLDGLAGERLYAVGECACTGLHGANRLASNSLSECFVFGRRAALKGLDDPPPGEARAVSRRAGRGAEPRDPPGRVAARGARAQRGRPRRAQPEPAPARAPGGDQREGARGDPRLARARGVPGARPARSTAGTRSSTPAARRRASRRGPRGAADRLGRRAHDEHARLLRRLPGARGSRRAARVQGRSERAGRPRVRPHRSRHVRAAHGRRARRRGARPRAPADGRGAPGRGDARGGRRVPRSGRPHRARLQLVARRGLRPRRPLRRNRALGGDRHPQARPGDLRRSRSSASGSRRTAASSSTTSAATSSPRKPWV